MKRTIYSAIFAAMMVPAIHAQITLLPAYHEPTIGVQGEVEYDSSVVIPRNIGQNQTWDFSTFLKTGTVASTGTFMAASAAPHASLFPGATLAENRAGEYTYYKSSSSPSQFEMMGAVQQGTGGVLNLSNTKIMLAWPISYGTTFSDAYTGTVSGVFSGTYTGSHTMTATGSGTVILPGGSVMSNALQLKNVYKDLLTMVTTTDTATINLDGTSYIYYHGTQRYPIVTISHNSFGDSSGTFSSTEILVNYLVAVGITDYNFDASFAIYPNPARDHFIVNFGNSSRNNCVIEVFDITGKLEKRVDLGNQEGIETTVDIRELSSGLHIVRTTLGDQRSVRKLVIE
jgi:hypothetical protein